MDYETMKEILSKTEIQKYKNINEDQNFAMSIWNSLKMSENDSFVNYDKLRQLISNPNLINLDLLKVKSKEEVKLPQSGLTKVKSHKQLNKFPLSSRGVKKMNLVHNNRYNAHSSIDTSFASVGSKLIGVDSSVKNKSSKQSNSHIDELVKKKQEFYKKVLEKKKEKEENEVKICSFRPKTNPRKRPAVMPVRPGSKNEHLYKISKHVTKPKVDKSTDEIDYERFKNEYTFTPNILPNARRLAKSRLDKNSKSVKDLGISSKSGHVDSSRSIPQTPVRLEKSQLPKYSSEFLNLKINRNEYKSHSEKTPEKDENPPLPHQEKSLKNYSDKDLVQSQELLE